MVFTPEEFDLMVREVLCDKPTFGTLAHIVEVTARPRVAYLCRTIACLSGRECEEDIMQNTQLKIMQKVASDFLLRQTADGGYNNDPQGFSGWIKKVAENECYSYARTVGGRDARTVDLDDPLYESQTAEEMTFDDTDERRALLQEAFSTVLDADASVYKVLTWIALFVFMLNSDAKKCRSSEEIVRVFENRTLFEMYKILREGCRRIPWLVLSEEQDARIRAALYAVEDDGRFSGDCLYREFFMMNKGERAPKKSVSDWVNRMNALLRRRMTE